MIPGVHELLMSYGSSPQWLGDIDSETLLENLKNTSPNLNLIREALPQGFTVDAYMTKEKALVCIVLSSKQMKKRR
ncbi:MAG TPA: hypothetical protein VK473_03605 [Terriglobales bacterium]|nr:hypothetical protein [Terriglobales bacterium]